VAAWINLYRALGGGWTPAAEPAATSAATSEPPNDTLAATRSGAQATPR
jgi:hypothetical protein